MPPEKAIEFKIELQPGIAPIAKSLYQMTPMELKEDSTTRLARQRLYPLKYIT
jgi:hypothetical protein